jgi:peptidoglycan/LPS O-acetylase OafA/YrhL
MNLFVSGTNNRIFGLDLLRAFAIICVVHGHGKHFIYGTSLDWLGNLHLPHGVDLFFVLSGYLIGRSIMKYADQGTDTLLKATPRFYLRTALRILPDYLLMLAVYILVVSTGVIPGNMESTPLWRFATLTQNISTPFMGFYWESWSTPVQWWFYLCFPLLMLLLHRTFGPKAVPGLVAAVIIGSTLFRISVSEHVNSTFDWDIWIRKTVFSRTDTIYVGVLAAWFARYHSDGWKRHRWVSLAAGAAVMAAVLFIPHEVSATYINIIYPILTAIAIGLMLPALTSWESAPTAISRPITALSLLSYAMFLTNLLACQIIDTHFADFSHAHGVTTYLCFWLATILLTLVLYLAVERWFMLLRNKVARK